MEGVIRGNVTLRNEIVLGRKIELGGWIILWRRESKLIVMRRNVDLRGIRRRSIHVDMFMVPILLFRC